MQAFAQNCDASDMLQKLRHSKEEVEDQLEELLERNTANESIMDQLSDSEVWLLTILHILVQR